MGFLNYIKVLELTDEIREVTSADVTSTIFTYSDIIAFINGRLDFEAYVVSKNDFVEMKPKVNTYYAWLDLTQWKTVSIIDVRSFLVNSDLDTLRFQLVYCKDKFYFVLIEDETVLARLKLACQLQFNMLSYSYTACLKTESNKYYVLTDGLSDADSMLLKQAVINYVSIIPDRLSLGWYCGYYTAILDGRGYILARSKRYALYKLGILEDMVRSQRDSNELIRLYDIFIAGAFVETSYSLDEDLLSHWRRLKIEHIPKIGDLVVVEMGGVSYKVSYVVADGVIQVHQSAKLGIGSDIEITESTVGVKFIDLSNYVYEYSLYISNNVHTQGQRQFDVKDMVFLDKQALFEDLLCNLRSLSHLETTAIFDSFDSIGMRYMEDIQDLEVE